MITLCTWSSFQFQPHLPCLHTLILVHGHLEVRNFQHHIANTYGIFSGNRWWLCLGCCFRQQWQVCRRQSNQLYLTWYAWVSGSVWDIPNKLTKLLLFLFTVSDYNCSRTYLFIPGLQSNIEKTEVYINWKLQISFVVAMSYDFHFCSTFWAFSKI